MEIIDKPSLINECKNYIYIYIYAIAYDVYVWTQTRLECTKGGWGRLADQRLLFAIIKKGLKYCRQGVKRQTINQSILLPNQCTGIIYDAPIASSAFLQKHHTPALTVHPLLAAFFPTNPVHGHLQCTHCQ